MIIGLTGTLGAGKGTVAEVLMKKGFKHYSVRQFLLKEIIRRGLPNNRDSMVDVANILRAKHGPSYIAEELYREAHHDGGNAIIESLRAVGEVKSLKEKGNFFLIAVDADQKTRYARIIDRASETDNISFEEFVKNEEREMQSTDPAKQHIEACIALANVSLKNNTTIEDLEKSVETVLAHFGNKPEARTRREDILPWDDYFMGVSILSGKRSKDPSTQVGACIVSSDMHIVGVGYNGFPRGCSDNVFPWARSGEKLETKYPYVVHAELNAILNSTRESLKDCTIYIDLFPCNECAKAIIQSGIKRVVYLHDYYKNEAFTVAAKKMFDSSGIEYAQLKPKQDAITISFEDLKKSREPREFTLDLK